MTELDYRSAWDYVLNRLGQELSPRLYYHSLVHTRDDVAKAVERLARMANVGEEDFILVMTAAYYHDLGFVLCGGDTPEDATRRAQHEMLSAEMCRVLLPRFHYTSEQIEIVCNIIMATRLPQQPKTFLEQIIADADLDSLGREDYWEVSNRLRREMQAYGAQMTDMKWYELQLMFLGGHKYFTAEARSIRDETKHKNLEGVKQILSKLT